MNLKSHVFARKNRTITDNYGRLNNFEKKHPAIDDLYFWDDDLTSAKEDIRQNTYNDDI
jgi:hypothetical protein